MPRRRPGQLRAGDLPRRRDDRDGRGSPARAPLIPGLSPHGNAILARLERRRRWPGTVAEALRVYGTFVRRPDHPIYDYEASGGCGIWECCPDPHEARAMLLSAAAALPRRDARELRKKLKALDDLW